MKYEIVVGWYRRFDKDRVVIEDKVIIDYDEEDIDKEHMKMIVADKLGYYYVQDDVVETDKTIDFRYFDISTYVGDE